MPSLQLLLLEPQENLNLGVDNTARLALKNRTAQNIAWKLKVNAQGLYVVKPSKGQLKHNESVNVQIVLREVEKRCDLPAHRFMVQASAVGAHEDFNDLDWTAIPPQSIQTVKLRITGYEQLTLTFSTCDGGVRVTTLAGEDVVNPTMKFE